MTEKKKEKKEKKEKPLTALDKLKLEIAEEIGLLDKVKTVGWANLSAQEAGFLGGMMSKKLREEGLSGKDLENKAFPAQLCGQKKSSKGP